MHPNTCLCVYACICCLCVYPSTCIQEQQLYKEHYTFIGKIMGAGMRTSNPLGLDMPPLIWKRFLLQDVSVRDLAGVCVSVCAGVCVCWCV